MTLLRSQDLFWRRSANNRILSTLLDETFFRGIYVVIELRKSGPPRPVFTNRKVHKTAVCNTTITVQAILNPVDAIIIPTKAPYICIEVFTTGFENTSVVNVCFLDTSDFFPCFHFAPCYCNRPSSIWSFPIDTVSFTSALEISSHVSFWAPAPSTKFLSSSSVSSTSRVANGPTLASPSTSEPSLLDTSSNHNLFFTTGSFCTPDRQTKLSHAAAAGELLLKPHRLKNGLLLHTREFYLSSLLLLQVRHSNAHLGTAELCPDSFSLFSLLSSHLEELDWRCPPFAQEVDDDLHSWRRYPMQTVRDDEVANRLLMLKQVRQSMATSPHIEILLQPVALITNAIG